jgi:hypothetical protein
VIHELLQHRDVDADTTSISSSSTVQYRLPDGICTRSASVAAVALGRRAFAAETDPGFADLAAERIRLSPAARWWSSRSR